MRRSPFVIGLFVVIALALGGATTAFAALDKTVTVSIDGQARTLRTFAGTVSGVLARAGIAVGTHDTVAPDLGAPVRNGSVIYLRHGRPLKLTLDGHPRTVWVTALSVNEALGQLGLRAAGAYLSTSRSLSIPRQGLLLTIRMPQRITVLSDGRRYIKTTTLPTVRALLANLGIRLARTDRTNLPLGYYPTTGTVVEVTRIRTTAGSEDVAIPFATQVEYTDALYEGNSEVVQYGAPGVRVLSYRMTWRNGSIVARTLVGDVVTATPRSQIVEYGTKPMPVSSLNWGALANCESSGNPQSVSPGGTYRGLYQFSFSTWWSVGGSGDPINASAGEQTYRAELLFERDGDAPWPVCGHYLYS